MFFFYQSTKLFFCPLNDLISLNSVEELNRSQLFSGISFLVYCTFFDSYLCELTLCGSRLFLYFKPDTILTVLDTLSKQRERQAHWSKQAQNKLVAGTGW